MVKAAERTAIVAGATGLIGAELVRRLLAHPAYRRVVALSRRPLNKHERLSVVEATYDDLEVVLDAAVIGQQTLDVFCCLGTTLRRAGSRSAFRRVDHDYVIALGRWAAAARAHRFVVVSAAGANASSPVFYNRVKGEMERDIAALRLPYLVIVRPSLLTGERPEFRPAERLAQALAAPLRALLPAGVRPIAAADVAQSMLDAALAPHPPRMLDSAQMQGAARVA